MRQVTRIKIGLCFCRDSTPAGRPQWPPGSRSTPRCNPVGLHPPPLSAGREPISATPPALPIGRRGAKLVPRDATLSAPYPQWPVGSRSQHPRRPNFIGPRGADLPRDATLSAPSPSEWPVGSRSQHPRRPNFIGPRGADLPRDATLSAPSPSGPVGSQSQQRPAGPTSLAGGEPISQGSFWAPRVPLSCASSKELGHRSLLRACCWGSDPCHPAPIELSTSPKL